MVRYDFSDFESPSPKMKAFSPQVRLYRRNVDRLRRAESTLQERVAADRQHWMERATMLQRDSDLARDSSLAITEADFHDPVPRKPLPHLALAVGNSRLRPGRLSAVPQPLSLPCLGCETNMRRAAAPVNVPPRLPTSSSMPVFGTVRRYPAPPPESSESSIMQDLLARMDEEGGEDSSGSSAPIPDPRPPVSLSEMARPRSQRLGRRAATLTPISYR